MSGPGKPPPGDADEEGAGRAHAGRFGGGEQAAIDAADDEGEQQQRRPDVAQALEPLLPRSARTRAGRKPGRSAADDA